MSGLKYRNQVNFLDAVIENSPFAMWVSDEKGIMIRANQSLRNILNLSDDMIIGKYNVLYDENLDAQGFMSVVEAVFNDLQSARFTMFWKGTKAGDVDLSVANELWIDVSMFPITDEDGKLVNVVCQYVDITERKKAEEELRVNRILLRDVLDIVPVFICAKNLDGKFILVNKKLSDFYGSTVDAMTNVLHADLCEDENELRAMLADDREVIESGKPKFIPEETMENPDGSIIVLETYKIPSTAQGEPVVLIASNDITERKLSEEKLEEANTIINKSPSIAFTWKNEEGWPVKYVSENVGSLLGYTVKDFISGEVAYLKCIHPDDIERVTQEVMEVSSDKSKEEFVHEPYRVVTKDGKVKFVSDWTFIVRDEKGNITHYKGIIVDITERKKAEKIKETLFNISNALNVTDDMHALYSKIRAFLGEIIDTTNFYIVLYDKENESISFEYYEDETFDRKGYLPAGRKFGKGLTEYVISSCKPLLATKQKQDELAKQGKIEVIGARSDIWLGAPLKVENQVIGVLAVQSYNNPNLYSEKDINILAFVSEAIALAVTRKRSEVQVRKDLKEKIMLLQEIHHRTKNNLQTISSLMQLQENTIKTKEDALNGFKVTQDRIRTMAKAYEILLRSEYMSEITLSDYITELADELRRNYDIHRNIKIIYSLEDVKFESERLSKLGLIVNEILTNAMKYAFKGKEKGSIHITLKDAKDHFTLKISDDGIGIPEKIKIPNPETFGLSLVDMLVSEFNGTYSVERKNGTSFTLKIPKES